MDFLLQALFSPLPTPAIISLFAVAAATLFYLNSRPAPLRTPADLKRQTLGVKNGARKTALLKGNNNLIRYCYDDATTLYEVFQRGLKVSGDYVGTVHPPFLFVLNCQQVPLRRLGSSGDDHHWIIGELACYTYSMVAVPLYDTLGPEALVFIIDRAEISTVLCDNQGRAETLLQNREGGQSPVLKTIVVMDSFDPELVKRGAQCGVDVVSMQDVEPPKPDDLSIVCFTSGTTGNPKGAMLTHENVVSNAAGVIMSFDVRTSVSPTTQDVSISFLPLAHMFERVVQTVMYGSGARVGFFQGDIRLLPDDMKALRPTIFPVVPRLLNRVYDKVQSGAAASPFKKWLLNFAVERKYAEVKEGIVRNNSIWDKLIFHKVQESLGGRVRVMVTGAAPISPSVLNFLRAALGCQIFEAYGQTECTAGCTFTMPGDATSGHVGAPLPCNIVKLVDVEEMNYFASNGEGEVKDVHLHPEQFTIENGLLTPTLKAKRAELKALFQPQIDTLYANIQ
ncbi:hypothetical protein F2P81_022594 [Scophthalmus maximus]|uniref:long-chain-fatty-acid--CoA ligase n=1 Tax=Scophthalmus maximus TaxID=52904 RepID=A0A6A4RUN6_SCOMX|nr:hypothetical protein F2P81_022594 [Scophthalmus maximus]